LFGSVRHTRAVHSSVPPGSAARAACWPPSPRSGRPVHGSSRRRRSWRRPADPRSRRTIPAMTRDTHRPLRAAWIVEAVRTPIGRYGGALASVPPDDLAAAVLRAALDRPGIDLALAPLVTLGCANTARA